MDKTILTLVVVAAFVVGSIATGTIAYAGGGDDDGGIQELLCDAGKAMTGIVTGGGDDDDDGGGIVDLICDAQIDGAPGATGATGMTGMTGMTGATGMTGEQGLPGTSTTLSLQTCSVGTSVVGIDSNGNLICQGPTSEPCPSGTTLDTSTGLCQGITTVSQTCLAGFNLVNGQCTTTPRCGTGNYIGQGQCRFDTFFSTECNGPFGSCSSRASCPDGSVTLSEGQCRRTFISSSSCPSGSELISNQCVLPACPSGSTFDAVNGQCLIPINDPPMCPSGTTLNDITGLCG